MTTSIVIGGAGFLGSHLVDALARRGESIIVLENLTTGRLGNLESAISSGRVTFVYADVAIDGDSLSTIVAQSGAIRISTIYHLAPPSSRLHSDAELLPLINLAIAHRAKLIISSDAFEGLSGGADHMGQRLHDNDPRHRGESVTKAVWKHDLDVRVVRFFNCYGPRMQGTDGSFVSALFKAAVNCDPFPIHGTGEQTQPMTFVRDAIELLLIVTDRSKASLAPVDIGNDDRSSLVDIAKALARILRRDFVPEYVSGAVEDEPRFPDLTRARALGWVPSTSLERGLQITYNWFTKESRLFV
jgi:nucleoside-diphosphate-sugar epimerase